MSKSIRILLFVLLLGAVPAWGQVPLTTTGPAISYIVPTSAPVGATSVLLTVYGKNFVSGNATITWNGTAMPTTFVASGKLYTTVPGKFLTAPAVVKIAVATRLGSTAAVPFTITGGTSTDSNMGTSPVINDQMSTSTTFALALALPGGTVGVAYRASLVKGGTPPYAMAAGALLPAGITFDGTTGYLVGAPKAAGAYAFGVSIKDSAGHTGSRNFTMSVLASSSMIESNTVTSPLQIVTTGLPAGNAGSAYNATLTATGGRPPYAWRILNGSLPPGLTLNGTTGTITGTPTMMVTASFVVEVKDTAAGTATHTYSVNIGAGSGIQQIPR